MEAETIVNEEQKPEEGLINVSGIARQLIFSKLAHYCTNDNGVDLYFLLEAIRHLRADVGDKILEDRYKEKSDSVKLRLAKAGRHIFKIKLYYDSLGNKELSDIDKENRIYKLYIREVKRLSPIMKTIYDVFHLYVENTNIKYQVIPNEYFKKSERKYTTFDLKKSDRDEEESSEETD